MANTMCDLVLDTGELIRLECPEKYQDEFYESINNSMKMRERWSAQQWDGCTATFLGMSLSSVNMARVVGLL
jgi:hypothetical protein